LTEVHPVRSGEVESTHQSVGDAAGREPGLDVRIDGESAAVPDAPDGATCVVAGGEVGVGRGAHHGAILGLDVAVAKILTDDESVVRDVFELIADAVLR